MRGPCACAGSLRKKSSAQRGHVGQRCRTAGRVRPGRAARRRSRPRQAVEQGREHDRLLPRRQKFALLAKREGVIEGNAQDDVGDFQFMDGGVEEALLLFRQPGEPILVARWPCGTPLTAVAPRMLLATRPPCRRCHDITTGRARGRFLDAPRSAVAILPTSSRGKEDRLPFEPLDQYLQRKKKLAEIEALGEDPYPHRFEQTRHAARNRRAATASGTRPRSRPNACRCAPPGAS